MSTIKHTHGVIDYFLKGESADLLILGGIHGNEYETSQIAQEYIKKNAETFPSFMFIPKASPSAVAGRTRKNRQGHDLNRNFIPLPFDEEAATLMHILSRVRATLCIDFHEDPDRTKAMYIYDTQKFSPEKLTSFRSAILATGASLYTGIDDADDANLGLKIDEGYVSTQHENLKEFPGFSSSWITRRKVAKRVITVEIPGKASRELKVKLIRAIFTFFCPSRRDTIGPAGCSSVG